MKRRSFLTACGAVLAAGVINHSAGQTQEDPMKYKLGLPMIACGLQCTSDSLRYLLHDLFSTDRAAGSVIGTAAEPGPGSRAGADSSNQASISSGALAIVGAAVGAADPRIYNDTPVIRAAGQMGILRFKVAAGKRLPRTGFIAANGSLIHTIRRTTAEAGAILDPGTLNILFLYDGCWYDLALFLRASGCLYALNDGAGLELVYLSSGVTNNPVYVGEAANNAGDDQSAAYGRWSAPPTLYFPSPLAEVAAPANDYEVNTGRNNYWVEVEVTRAGGNAGLRLRSVDGNNEYRVYHDGTNVKMDKVIGGVVSAVASTAVAYAAGAKLQVRMSEIQATIYYNGTFVAGTHRRVGDGELISGATIGIYSTDAGNAFANLYALPVRLGTPAPLAQSLLASRPVMCVGDSISNGALGVGYQNKLRKLLGDGYATIDLGVSGNTTAQMRARFAQHLASFAPAYTVVLGGGNDLMASRTAAQVQTDLQAMYTAAHNAGAIVVAVTMTPWKNAANWSAARQTDTDTINAWILNTATDVDYRVDAYTALEDPGAPDTLLAANDSGDHLHPSATGYTLLGTTIYNGVTWS
jgi:lysophospholipase L1-like esterase